MNGLDEKIEGLTSQKRDLEDRINKSTVLGEKTILGFALKKVDESLVETKNKKFLKEVINGGKKTNDLSRFAK